MVAKYFGAAKLVTYEEGGEDPSGLIQNGEQGVFEYSVENDAIVIGQAAGSGSFKEDYINPYQLTKLSANVTVPSSGYTYTVDPSSYFAAYAIGIDDWNPAYALYGLVDSMSLKIEQDISSATITYKLDTTTASYTISDIGTTTDAKITDYVASPVLQSPRTAFTSAFSEAAVSLFGAGVVIPFPTGAATALFRDDVVFADDNVTAQSLSFSEFQAGDISQSYIDILTAAGYVEVTGTDAYGSEFTAYEKTLVDETATAGKTVIRISVAFDADSSEFDATIESYSYPKVYEGVDFTKANEIIGTYNSSAAKAFPLFATSEKVTAVHVEDYASIQACKLFIDVTIAIAAEADANAYVTSLTSLATAAGFVLATTYTWATDGYEELNLGDNLSILVAGKYDDNGAYAGSIIVELSDSTAA